MFITKKHISRRMFLRSSVGVTLALPFLDAMVPAQTPLAKTAARPLQRFGFVYVPHGSIMKDWTPAQEGVGFEFSPILKPMERFRDHLNVLTGLTNNGENGHSPSTAMWLSGTFPAKGSVIHLGTTVDQIIAAKVGQDTTFPSMEFATEDHSSHLGSCAGDFLCSYMSTISWRTPRPRCRSATLSPTASRMLLLRSSRARRSCGDAASPPNMRSNTTRGLISIGSGCVGVRHEIVLM